MNPDSDEEAEDTNMDPALKAVNKMIREHGMAADFAMPPKKSEGPVQVGPENLPKPGSAEQERLKRETLQYFAKHQRDRCQRLGDGTWNHPKRMLSDGTPSETYFWEKALYDTCNGKGEAKATLCVALSLKDEYAGKAFAKGDIESAEMNYRIALWLLCEDDSEFEPSNATANAFAECPGAPTHSRVSRFQEDAEVCAAPPVADLQGETDLSEEDMVKLKEAERKAVERYGSELSFSEQAANLRQTLRLNIAACALKTGTWTIARHACEAVLARNVSGAGEEKAQFRLAQALEGEGSYGKALKAASALLKLQPNSREARDLQVRLKKKKEKVDDTYKKMSKIAEKEESALYTEEQQRRERSKAAFMKAAQNSMNVELPPHIGMEFLQKASPEERTEVMKKIFEEQRDKRLQRFEDMGLTPEMGAHVEKMYAEGYRADQLHDLMQCMVNEDMDELNMSMTEAEKQKMRGCQHALQIANEEFNKASPREEQQKALEELKRCSADYKATVKELRRNTKERLNNEMSRLLAGYTHTGGGLMIPKAKDSASNAKEQAFTQGVPAQEPAASASVVAGPTAAAAIAAAEAAVHEPRKSAAKRPKDSCCAGVKQCVLG